MTRSQVRFLLGTPMVPDAFDNDRWDYYYFFSSRHIKEPLKRRLTVYFQDEKVQRYENQGVPTQADLEQVERDLIQAALDRADGNISESARALGLTRRGLYLKIKRLGLDARTEEVDTH